MHDLAYSFNNMHQQSAMPFQGNHLLQKTLGVIVLIFLCVDICEPSGNKGILPTVQTSTANNPGVLTPPTSKPLSTPRLNDGTSTRLFHTKKINEPTDSSRTRAKGIISILGTESWTMDTSQVGKSSETTGKIDPFKISLYIQRGTTSARPSELYSKNEKTFWPNDKTVSKSEVLPSPKPSRSVKTLALSPTPNIGTNKPTISSPSTGSLIVARETIARPEASPSFIDPNVLSTSGPRVRTTPRATRTQNHRVQTLSPTPTPTPTPYRPFKQQHRCPLGKGSKQECICMNCEGNTSPGLSCCIDYLHPDDMANGIVLLMRSLSMIEFLSKVSSLRYLAGEVIKDSCSKSPCFQNEIARKRRSNREWEYGTPIKSWDGSPITPTNTLNPDSRRDAQPSSMAPRVQKPINVNVVIFKIGQHPEQQHQIYTAFYVSIDGTNKTQIVQTDVSERIIRSKRDLFKEKLNISLDRIVSWRSFSRTFSIGLRGLSPTTVYPSSSTVLPGAGNPNIEGQEGRNSTTNMSRNTFIIVLVTGIGGFVVLAIIIIYMLFKFLRRMKGEFVPDKACPEEQKTDVGSDQLIPSFIDPSAPRITDVPKKTVRTPAQTNGNAGGGGSGGGGGGSKKAKKPMGVKVTYKPPKWD